MRRIFGLRGPLVALVIAGVVAGFYGQLLFGGSLNGDDWSRHYYYYEWIRTALTRYGTLPLYMTDALHTPNFLGNAQSPLLGPLVGLLYVLPADAYIKLLVVLYTSAGLVGMMALLEDLGVELPVAAVLAVIFGFNGYFVSHICTGHHWSLGSFLLPPLLFLYRRAVRGQRPCLWLAAAVNACGIFEGQHHPFIWNNVFLVLYAVASSLEVRTFAPLKAWGAFVLASCGLGAVKLLPMWSEFASYVPERWLLGLPPESVFWSLVAPVRDEHGYGLWWEYDFYIGVPAFLLLVGGLVAAWRQALTWIVPGTFFLLISLDLSAWKPLPEPWSLIKDLPVWSSQRCPSRFLIVALTAFLIAAGIGLQTLWASAQLHWPRVRLLPLARITLMVILANLYLAARPWEEGNVGAPFPEHDHRFGAPLPGAVAPKEFHPNRLVYEVDTSQPMRVVLPLPDPDKRLEWRPLGFDADARDGMLAVSVPAGRRDLVVVYRPRFLYLGAFMSAATVVGGIVWELRRRRR